MQYGLMTGTQTEQVLPNTYKTHYVVVLTPNMTTAGGGTPNFNWMDGHYPRNLNLSSFWTGLFNGGGATRHWVTTGY